MIRKYNSFDTKKEADPGRVLWCDEKEVLETAGHVDLLFLSNARSTLLSLYSGVQQMQVIFSDSRLHLIDCC